MCCLFGLIDYANSLSVRRKEKIIKVLSAECEVRGTDATGVAYLDGNRMAIVKAALPAHKMHFKFKSNPPVIMGHTRMTTQGSELINDNNHPFYSEQLGFALAHNGMLHNDKKLRKEKQLPETKIETDSYIAVQLIDSQNNLCFDSLKYMAESIIGSFCFTVLSKDNELYIVKGDNPMAIAKFDGYYIYASTYDILEKALKRLNLKKFTIVDIDDGNILRFDMNGQITKTEFSLSSNYDDFYFGAFRPGRSTTSTKIDDEYLDDLICYANFLGIDDDIVIKMFEEGYSYFEIEEMLYETELYELEDTDYAEL